MCIRDSNDIASLSFVKEIWDGEQEIQKPWADTEQTASPTAVYDLETLRKNNWGYKNIRNIEGINKRISHQRRGHAGIEGFGTYSKPEWRSVRLAKRTYLLVILLCYRPS